jgi:hypothetical protein
LAQLAQGHGAAGGVTKFPPNFFFDDFFLVYFGLFGGILWEFFGHLAQPASQPASQGGGPGVTKFPKKKNFEVFF